MASWKGSGQSNQQIWVEYAMTHSLSNSWTLNHPLRYSTLLGELPWKAVTYLPSFSWSATERLDFVGGLTFAHVWQTAKVNTLEIRPMLGTRLALTPNSRIRSSILLRLEQRNIRNLVTMNWNSSYRMRLKIEGVVPINGRTMSKDKLWYAIMDAEWFVADVHLRERFSNLFRVNSALGYRINYNFRVECFYAYQQSKNQLGDVTFNHDNVFRFRLRHFMNNHRPEVLSGEMLRHEDVWNKINKIGKIDCQESNNERDDEKWREGSSGFYN